MGLPAPARSPSRARSACGSLHRGVVIADTELALRVLETSQPPAFYLPPGRRVDGAARVARTRHTVCEWKGAATYWSLRLPDGTAVPDDRGGRYESPVDAFESIRGHFAFYAQRVDECWVDDERVVPNEGSFYGGWITSNVVGPFKGAPGTRLW